MGARGGGICSPTQPVPDNESAAPPQAMPKTPYPANDISLEAYFAEFGGIAAMDLKAKKIRPDVEAKIREQMIGTQVTWEGYVKKIADAGSGGLTLVLSKTDAAVGLESAMIRFSAELHDQLDAYQQGDHVRVVAVFDDIMTVFPLLSGHSVESISES